MKTKFHFENEDCEMAFNDVYFKEKGITEAYKAKIVRGTGGTFCKFHSEFALTSEACGAKNCSEYIPRNGKSGICKYHGFVYEPGEKTTLKHEKNNKSMPL